MKMSHGKLLQGPQAEAPFILTSVGIALNCTVSLRRDMSY